VCGLQLPSARSISSRERAAWRAKRHAHSLLALLALLVQMSFWERAAWRAKRHAHSLLALLALLVQKHVPSARSMSSRERAACCGETSRPPCNSLAILSSSNTLAARRLRQHLYFGTSNASKLYTELIHSRVCLQNLHVCTSKASKMRISGVLSRAHSRQ
jgi:hypothetical protein